MNDKVLVTYASKYGATVEIAARIGQILHQEDVSNDVLGVDDVGDVTAYQAVVLGSAVYMGGWRKKAANFLKENQEALAEHHRQSVDGNHDAKLDRCPARVLIKVEDHLWLDEGESEDTDEIQEQQSTEDVERLWK